MEKQKCEDSNHQRQKGRWSCEPLLLLLLLLLPIST